MTVASNLIDLLVSHLSDKLSERYTIDDNGCWVWTSRVDKTGYPLISVSGATSPKSARLVAWWLNVGEVPDKHKLFVQDTCDPLCVNPGHVIVSRTLPSRQKLNDDKVRCIRASDEPTDVLAERYGVTVTTIRNVRAFRSWVDVR